MKNKYLAVILIMLVAPLLAGCDRSGIPIRERWASVSGSQIDSSTPGEQFYFNVPVDPQLIESAIPVHIQVSGRVDSGSLHFELRRPDGSAAWMSSTFGSGDYSDEIFFTPEAGLTGTYTLGLVWEAGTRAEYNLSWSALRINALVLLPGLGMILVALFATGFTARRRLGWRYFGWGALLWVLTVALKFAWAIPTNQLVLNALNFSYTDLGSPGNLISYLYIGSLTGIFEVGVTWLILRNTKLGAATWSQALAFGIGFGTVEALLLGAFSLFSALAGLLAPSTLPTATLGQLAQQNDPLYGLAPVVERASVILAHTYANVLVFYAIARRQARWGWLAILFKTLLDTPAAFAQFWGVSTTGRIWTIEAVIMVFGLIGLWGTQAIARRYPRAEHTTAPAAPSHAAPT